MNILASAAEKAVTAWGKSCPDWIAALADACDAHSVRKVAGKLNVSPALVSLTLRKQQRGTELLEARVKSRLMIELLSCPVMGLIDANTCRMAQGQPLITTNAHRVALYRACHNGCLYFKGEKA